MPVTVRLVKQQGQNGNNAIKQKFVTILQYVTYSFLNTSQSDMCSEEQHTFLLPSRSANNSVILSNLKYWDRTSHFAGKAGKFGDIRLRSV